MLGHLTLQLELIQRIREAQLIDSTVAALKKDAEQGVCSEFRVFGNELLRF